MHPLPEANPICTSGCAAYMRASCIPTATIPSWPTGPIGLPSVTSSSPLLSSARLIDPVRNKWVLVFGVIACAGVLPLALIAGSIRGIPFYWRLIDCSFGVIGVVPLLICLRYVRQLEETT